MSTARVISTGSYLPGAPLSNSEIADLAGPLPEEVLESLETLQRHWLIDPKSGKHALSNSEMAAAAAQDALARAGITSTDVGVVVVSTASPEYHLPTVSSLVLEQLHIRNAISADVRSGCAGFIQALLMAESLLTNSTARYAVVVGSEAISPLLFPLYRFGSQQVRIRDRIKVYTFGDGAGAVVLERTDDETDGGLGGYAFQTVGGTTTPGMRIVGGSTDIPLHEQVERTPLIDLFVDVRQAGRMIPPMLLDGLKHLLDATNTLYNEPSIVVIPEGNAGYVTQELLERDELPDYWLALKDRIYENLDVVGATGSAAVPLALHQAVVDGRLKPGETALLLAIETSKWIYAGARMKWR